MAALSEKEKKRAAHAFSEKWATRGYEKGDTHSFWLELLRTVYGMDDVTSKCRFEQKTSAGGFIDVIIPDAQTIVEQKSRGVNLDKPELRQGVLVTPYEQAKRYADSLPNRERPDRIIVSNFGSIRIHDLNKEHPATDYVSFELGELAEQRSLLSFLTDPDSLRSSREKAASIDAGALIGKLHAALLEQYIDPESTQTQHALNVLCVRIVFCLFAEDAGLFEKDAFYRYLSSFDAQQLRSAFLELFKVLDTPVPDRDPYLSDRLRAFPYVNGGLFKGSVEIPNFTESIRSLLLDEVAQDTDWSQISPTIFGGVFESTLNPETRRSGGMHYTSPENIHKVIDPLFLDDLRSELDTVLTADGLTERQRDNRLRKFHEKLGSLTFFDPACGSGNFLTETYIELRRLENVVIGELLRNQTMFDFEEVGDSPVKVSLHQFYGIEINDFAVSVARTALWIAQLQANIESETIILREIEDLPLRDSASIHEGNALTMDWQSVLPAQRCSFVMGNPPFIGYSNKSAQQRADMELVFDGMKQHGLLDYVAGWYRKAADYMEGTSIEAAFVSTNSICQGQQVAPLWRPLFERGITINFAHRSFVWGNEASDQAHVHVVIVGFSYVARKNKVLFDVQEIDEGVSRSVDNINGYLVDAANVFIERRSKPLCDVVPMSAGGKPTENGNLLMWEHEKDELLKVEPAAEKWIRRFSMGEEFIKGKKRYCLWLVDCTPQELRSMPHVLERVRKVKEFRENSTKAATRKKAETPWLFDEVRPPKGDRFIGVPPVSSERRKYVPVDFVDNGMIPGNKLYFIADAGLYEFGVFTSQFHNAWMRAVTGRLEMRYNYSNTIVYNNFVWPQANDAQRALVEQKAQAVLDARDQYQGAALADLYDPDNAWLYPALTRAHRELDAAVEAAYGVDFGGDEQKIAAHLFDLYAQVTA